ncbi:MAG: hypothetical protein C0444_03765 [Microbacterium sp.]|nr:hypothetical protein [Microbacterium sp.]
MVDPVRIRSRWLKAGYVGAYLLVGFTLGRVLNALEVPSLLSQLIASAVFVTAIVVGARIFRARGEDPIPPRPWWQLTGRPKAGFVIAALLASADVMTWLGQGPELSADDVPVWILNSAVSAMVVVAYVRSSILLRRRAGALP